MHFIGNFIVTVAPQPYVLLKTSKIHHHKIYFIISTYKKSKKYNIEKYLSNFDKSGDITTTWRAYTAIPCRCLSSSIGWIDFPLISPSPCIDASLPQTSLILFTWSIKINENLYLKKQKHNQKKICFCKIETSKLNPYLIFITLLVPKKIYCTQRQSIW